MAKRFIDTEMFKDEWFCDLSKDCKLFFVYFITSCDHAGVLKLNKKLAEFQTGLKNIDTLIKELGNCLVTVGNGIYFMPKFIKFQYPNFPQSSVKQQDSALKILKSFGFWDDKLNSLVTVSKELPDSYVNDSVTVGFNRNKKVLFKDCDIFDKVNFKNSFPEWTKEKLSYYYDTVLTWSNEGNKKVDWVATVRNWAKRDELQGKIKFDKPVQKIDLSGLV